MSGSQSTALVTSDCCNQPRLPLLLLLLLASPLCRLHQFCFNRSESRSTFIIVTTRRTMTINVAIITSANTITVDNSKKPVTAIVMMMLDDVLLLRSR